MRFAFVSNNSVAPWGGSEELWSQAAAELSRRGHAVLACLQGWSPLPPRSRALIDAGATVASLRHRKMDTALDLARRGLGQPLPTAAARHVRRQLLPFRPDLVVISQMLNWDALPWMQACHDHRLPYVVIAQAASEGYWPGDDATGALRDLFQGARRVFFVSEHNRQLTEIQLALRLPNAAIARNPFLVDYDAPPQWPGGPTPPWRLACVARYSRGVKGHDLLFDVLGQTKWRERPLSVTCVGGGDATELRRLAEMLHATQGEIAGPTNDIAAVWREHHAMVLASRFEGLPLAVVEAMLAHRPCIVTPAGGSGEVIRDGMTGFVAESITTAGLDAALERAWARRAEWPEFGRRAGREIRQLFPRDPGGEFAASLLELVRA